MKKTREKSSNRRASVYDESFKIAIAREYLSGTMSHGQLAKKYGLSGEHTVRYFIKCYEKWEMEMVPNQELPAHKSDDTDLQEQLAMANLKITALEMLISTAEHTLGIDIRKKSGTK